MMASSMGASLIGASNAGLQSACRQRAGLSQLSTRQGGEQGRRTKLTAVRCSALPPDVAASAMADRLTSGTLPASGMDVAAVASSALDTINTWSLAVGVGLPCTVMDCGDHVHRSTLPVDDSLKLTVGGILLVSMVGSYLWATPGVAPGFFDMFVLAPLERRFRRNMKKVGRRAGAWPSLFLPWDSWQRPRTVQVVLRTMGGEGQQLVSILIVTEVPCLSTRLMLLWFALFSSGVRTTLCLVGKWGRGATAACTRPNWQGSLIPR